MCGRKVDGSSWLGHERRRTHAGVDDRLRSRYTDSDPMVHHYKLYEQPFSKK